MTDTADVWLIKKPGGADACPAYDINVMCSFAGPASSSAAGRFGSCRYS